MKNNEKLNILDRVKIISHLNKDAMKNEIQKLIETDEWKRLSGEFCSTFDMISFCEGLNKKEFPIYFILSLIKDELGRDYLDRDEYFTKVDCIDELSSEFKAEIKMVDDISKVFNNETYNWFIDDNGSKGTVTPKRGKFIVLEGIDGSGKSTQISELAKFLESKGEKVYKTFEPTDSPIGSIIKQIMTGRIKSDHKTIAGLFVADRLDHLQNDFNGILHKLNEGITVISDRYYFSSYAYHGIHMPLEWVIAANSLSADMLRADVTLYIDITPEESIKRLNVGRWHVELYETTDNLRKVRNKYLEAFEIEKERENIVIINGEKSPNEIQREIVSAVEGIF